MDASRRDLYKALIERGFDVTRTPNTEIHEDASDEYQLLWATTHQRVLFTHNIKDFINLSREHPYHSGIILANQNSWNVGQSIHVLSRVMSETTSDDWIGEVRWINDWCQ